VILLLVLFTRWPVYGGGIAIFNFGCNTPVYLRIAGVPWVKWVCNFEDSKRVASPVAGTSGLSQEPDTCPAPTCRSAGVQQQEKGFVVFLKSLRSAALNKEKCNATLHS